MKKGLSVLMKVFCVIAGIINFFLGFACYAAFKDDKDTKHKEFANYMFLGAVSGILILGIALFIKANDYVLNNGYYGNSVIVEDSENVEYDDDEESVEEEYQDDEFLFEQ